jgi:DNA-directed RNA polymerase subunit L
LKLNIVREEESYLELDFGGEGHSLLNLLQSVLTQDPDVEMAGYTKPHPLMDRSKLFIKTKKGKNPQEALKRAAKRAGEQMEEFLDAFKESLEKKD